MHTKVYYPYFPDNGIFPIEIHCLFVNNAFSIPLNNYNSFFVDIRTDWAYGLSFMRGNSKGAVIDNEASLALKGVSLY